MKGKRFYVHGPGEEETRVMWAEEVPTVTHVLGRVTEGEGTTTEVWVEDEAGRRRRLGGDCLLSSLPDRTDLFLCRREWGATAQTLKMQGNAHFLAGRLTEALAAYQQALILAPDWVALHLNSCLVNSKAAQWDAALADARRALQLDPSLVKAHYRLGQALYGARQFEECHKVLAAALDMPNILPEQAREIGLLLQDCEKEHGAGVANVSQEVQMAAKEARLPVAAFNRLRPYFELAQEAIKGAHFAKAMEVYRLILEINPDDYTSLFGMGYCLLNNKSNKFTDAIKVLSRLVRVHGDSSYGSWRMLGEAYMGARQFEDAIKVLTRASELLLKAHGQPQKQIDEQKKDLSVQLSKSYEGVGKRDLALHFVSIVLKQDDTHVNALLQYGNLMLQSADTLDEGLNVALRMVGSASKNRDVRRFFCRALKASPAMPLLMFKTLDALGSQMTSASYSFMASVAKEFSAVQAAILLLDRAVAVDPARGPGYVLSLVHVLEVDAQNGRALEVIRRWLNEGNPSFDVKGLSAKQVGAAWQSAPRKEIFMLNPNPPDLGHPSWAQTPDLDFLALLFALVKLLYLEGDFRPIPSIVELIEPVRAGWQFHTTNIRNEQAYYCCAVQSLEWHNNAFKENGPMIRDAEKVVHVVGDSHSLPCAWQLAGSGNILLKPNLVTGCKMWHLRKEADFFPKYNFERQLEQVPDGSNILFVLGEIDCRESLLVCVEKGRYASLEEGMLVVIEIFLNVVEELCLRKRLGVVMIHPVVPVLNPTRHIVEKFNVMYKQQVEQHPRLQWLDIYDELVEPSPEPIEGCQSKFKLRDDYAMDGTHLKPSYINLMKSHLDHAIP